MKQGYYKADTTNGVYYYGEYLDEPETDVLTPLDFYIDLKLLDTDEEITAFFGPEDQVCFDYIEDEYGINKTINQFKEKIK